MRQVVVVAVLVGACRSTNVTPDTAPLVEPAADPPPWFGAAGTPRIAGSLVDATGHPLAGTIHLRLSAPDATIWAGIDRLLIGARAEDVMALTEFDEGPLPADWVGELERRGIAVTRDIERDAACDALRAYSARGGARY